MEWGSGQQSSVGPLDGNEKNPGTDRGEESVAVGSIKSAMDNDEGIPDRGEESVHVEEKPVPAFYSVKPPEDREKVMKHSAEAKAAMDAMLARHKERTETSKRSRNPAAGGGKPAEEAEMPRISHERQLDAEIHKALLDIQVKLTMRRNRKMDEETLQLLKDMSNKFDMLNGDDDDEKGEIDDERGSSSATPLAKKTVAEEMAEEAERYASHHRLWEYKHSKRCGSFTEASEQLTNVLS